MSENNKFISWVKAHKTELIIAGVSATAIIGIILGLKNKDAIKELWDALENSLSIVKSLKNAQIKASCFRK